MGSESQQILSIPFPLAPKEFPNAPARSLLLRLPRFEFFEAQRINAIEELPDTWSHPVVRLQMLVLFYETELLPCFRGEVLRVFDECSHGVRAL